MGEINEDLAELSKEFRPKMTDVAINNKTTISCYLMNSQPESLDYSIYHVSLYPLLDKHGNLLALFNRTNRVNFAEAISQFLSIFNPSQTKKYNLINIKNITRRERAIIFLLIIGKSHKEIAEIISKISNRKVPANSISAIISRQIYPKLDVTHLSDLIIVAVRNNFLSNIPHELVRHLPRIIFVYSEKL